MHAINFVNPHQDRVLRPGTQGLSSSQWVLVVGAWLSFMLAIALAFLMARAGR